MENTEDRAMRMQEEASNSQVCHKMMVDIQTCQLCYFTDIQFSGHQHSHYIICFNQLMRIFIMVTDVYKYDNIYD